MASATSAHHQLTATQQMMSGFFTAAESGFKRFGASAVGAFFQAADAAGKYQLQMRLVQQQLQASNPMMEKLGGTITQLSTGTTRTIFSRTELAGMARELQQSGLSAGQINRILPQIAYGAEIEKMRGGSSPELFAKYMGATIKGYGLAEPGREREFSKFIDTYTRVASITHLNASGLRALEARVGATARLSGVTAQDFLTGSGWLTQRGINPNEVGTIWRNVLTNVIPHSTTSGHMASSQYQSLMMLGLLKAPDPTMAKRYIGEYMVKQHSLGFTMLDPAKMSAKKQEDYAASVMMAVTGSKALTGNLTDMFTRLHESFLHFRQLFGVRNAQGQITDDRQAKLIYEQAIRQAFNLRGMQGALLMAFEGPQSYNLFKAQAAHQAPLEERARQLRYTEATMKEMLPKQVSTLVQMLGGVSGGGMTVSGGPLDIMTHALWFLTDFMAKLSQFGGMHPKIMAQLGTLIGVAGIGGLGVAAYFAVANIVLLNRAILSLALSARMSAGTSVATGVAPAAAGLIPRLAAGIGQLLLWAIRLVNPWVAIGAGLVALFVAVWKNPATIGQWVGAVQGFLQFHLIPGFMHGLQGLITSMGSWWSTSFMPWWSNMWTNLLHFKLDFGGLFPGKPFSGLQDWWHTEQSAQHAAVGGQRIVAPGSHGSHLRGGGHDGSVTVGDIHVHAPHADHNKVAEAVMDRIHRLTPFNLRSGGTSYSSPRMSTYAATGGVA